MIEALNKKTFAEVGKFAVAGVINTGVDLAVLNSLIALFGASSSSSYPIMKMISFIVAATGSYVLNKYWVFKDKNNGSAKQAGFFFAVTIAGFLLNVLVSSLAFSVLTRISFGDTHVNATVGALMGTLIVLVWNFIGYKFFVFKK